MKIIEIVKEKWLTCKDKEYHREYMKHYMKEKRKIQREQYFINLLKEKRWEIIL